MSIVSCAPDTWDASGDTDKPVASETRVTSIGPHVMVLDTVIPESAVTLHSTYVGHKRTMKQAAHMRLASLRDAVRAHL